MEVSIERKGKVFTVILDRPAVRNAVDGNTAEKLAGAFRVFEKDDSAHVAVLWGKGGHFCAGADLRGVSGASPERSNHLDSDMSADGPMGPSRLFLSKPVIAAVSGYAVAGGLELACWCDLRVVEKTAVFGVFCRRWGVPLIDGGTQRLPRLIGMSRALDLILTGRPVGAEEALSMGLANRVVEPGSCREEAERLAAQIAEFPQICLRSDREAVFRGFGREMKDALKVEFDLGLHAIASGETAKGAARFVDGAGRHGGFDS